MSGEKSHAIPVMERGPKRGSGPENWPLRTFRWASTFGNFKKTWDKSPMSKPPSTAEMWHHTTLFALNTTTTHKKTAKWCPPPPKKGKPTSWRCKKSLQHTNVWYIHQHLPYKLTICWTVNIPCIPWIRWMGCANPTWPQVPDALAATCWLAATSSRGSRVTTYSQPHESLRPNRKLVGGFNPLEKYKSKWESSPIFGVEI